MKIAMITGASSGFGREFVRQIDSLYKELDEIWVVARRVERLHELQSRTMTKLRVFGGDLLEEEIYQEISEEVIRPSAEECARNSRARSTKMRWAIKA